MKQVPIVFLFVLSTTLCSGQTVDSVKINYEHCLDSLKILLEGNLSLKKAVFITENCFLDYKMRYENFDAYIAELVEVIQLWENANPLANYHYKDSVNLLQNLAIFKVLKDTIKFENSNHRKYYLLPYTYDFDDFFGNQNWTNMFVTKLISTHKGNCHSLPYLYKILANEIGANCWLALAPNHMYISNRCKKIGWYNTELTSGDFPVDAWIMASGYLPLRAIQSGIYMDTLSNQQSIALCVLDLAKGYEHKSKNYYDGFIIKCCNLSLKYYPLNAQAMLLKAETLKRIYEKHINEKTPLEKDIYNQMEELYVKIFALGYREMPEKMYAQWLQSVVNERNKYTNRAIKEAIQGNQK